MFIRAYLRASTEEQDAGRARESLEQFTSDYDKTIASVYLENASGATADRPELLRLLKDARKGDVLLVESIDRLSRLPPPASQLRIGKSSRLRSTPRACASLR